MIMIDSDAMPAHLSPLQLTTQALTQARETSACPFIVDSICGTMSDSDCYKCFSSKCLVNVEAGVIKK